MQRVSLGSLDLESTDPLTTLMQLFLLILDYAWPVFHYKLLSNRKYSALLHLLELKALNNCFESQHKQKMHKLMRD